MTTIRLSELEDHDYQVLESYWFRYSELAVAEYKTEQERKNLKDITEAIEKLYNESDGVMRELIEQGYFNATTETMDPYMAEQLGITKVKLSYMRNGLMQETAELIAYVV